MGLTRAEFRQRPFQRRSQERSDQSLAEGPFQINLLQADAEFSIATVYLPHVIKWLLLSCCPSYGRHQHNDLSCRLAFPFQIQVVC